MNSTEFHLEDSPEVVFQFMLDQGWSDGLPVIPPTVDRVRAMLDYAQREASELVIQASSVAKGGDVFVLDMGKPVKIVTLAKKLIRLMGRESHDENNGSGVQIKFTGLRPGEKLYEELLIDGDVFGTEHPKIMGVLEKCMPSIELKSVLSELKQACMANDHDQAIRILQGAVEGYERSEGHRILEVASKAKVVKFG